LQHERLPQEEHRLIFVQPVRLDWPEEYDKYLRDPKQQSSPASFAIVVFAKKIAPTKTKSPDQVQSE
jgi:hypothetical protein